MAAAGTPECLEELGDNASLLTPEDLALARRLIADGQEHLFSSWPAAGVKDGEKRQLMAQLRGLDAAYSGGLLHYISNARRLLQDSEQGKNPFQGCTPSVPEGVSLDFGSDQFRELERLGCAEAEQAAFVLVAGGLGERLGYSGIKLALPRELATERCFLQYYIESILALQARARLGRELERQRSAEEVREEAGGDGTSRGEVPSASVSDPLIPLAIMTSADTHEKTRALLKRCAYFGADPSQVVLLRQERVACLADARGRLALDPADPFSVLTKPHGHGDVHMLLHSSGLARDWLDRGRRWVAFFQDTNGLVFNALPAALGVSARERYAVNSLAVPRRAKEAIGGLACLTRADGSRFVNNVEYNQLDPLLRATVSPEGDVNAADGWSPYPGNINQLVMALPDYVAQLKASNGVVSEFVNPKYADAARTLFKSPPRLECMMQDFPMGLPSDARVGFTSINQVWAAYSPVKNNLADAAAKGREGNPTHGAAAGELDVYAANCKMLQKIGVKVAGPVPVKFGGIEFELWPQVVWSPLFAMTLDDLEAKIVPEKVRIGQHCTLVIESGDVRITELDLDQGALVVSAAEGEKTEIASLRVNNRGWSWEPLPEPDNGTATEEELMRGFSVVRFEQTALGK